MKNIKEIKMINCYSNGDFFFFSEQDNEAVYSCTILYNADSICPELYENGAEWATETIEEIKNELKKQGYKLAKDQEAKLSTNIATYTDHIFEKWW